MQVEIDNWVVVEIEDGFTLSGEIYNHPTIEDGSAEQTKRVVHVSECLGLLRDSIGNIYKIGESANVEQLDKLRATLGV